MKYDNFPHEINNQPLKNKENQKQKECWWKKIFFIKWIFFLYEKIKRFFENPKEKDTKPNEEERIYYPNIHQFQKIQPKNTNQYIKKTVQKREEHKIIIKPKPAQTLYESQIELDMHGDNPSFKNAFNWVPIIRDLLFESYENRVHIVKFITGKGLHSKNGIPVLRPLVYLTIERLGFHCSIDIENQGIIKCFISSYKNKININENIELQKIFSIETEIYDESTFKKIKNIFPSISNFCLKIICANKNLKQATRYVNLFEQSLKENNFKKYYRYLKSNLILSEIEMNRKEIESNTNIDVALKIFNVEDQILSPRYDGRPKFIPSLSIKFINTNKRDILNIVKKVLNASFKSNFSNFTFDFSSLDEENINNLPLDFIRSYVDEAGFHIYDYLCGKKYKFIVYNDFYGQINEEEEEEEFNEEEEEEEEEFNEEEEEQFSDDRENWYYRRY